MIGVCTDSSSQLPTALAVALGVEVVPLVVRVDGVDHDDGVDLDADGFYASFTADRSPEVSTAAPPIGRLAAAHTRLVRQGATEVVSVHMASGLSSTVDACRLAAAEAAVPVHVIDSGTASFGLGAVVWDLVEGLAEGRGLGEAIVRAEGLGARTTSVWIQGALDLIRRGGRVGTVADADGAEGQPVLSLRGSSFEVLDTVADVDAAIAAMAAAVVGVGPCRVGVGHSDVATEEPADRLEEAVAALDDVCGVARYRVGPSVGAHTGPGTVGLVITPLD